MYDIRKYIESYIIFQAFYLLTVVCSMLERLISSLRDDIYLHQNIIISKTNYGMGLKFHPARGIIREKAF